MSQKRRLQLIGFLDFYAAALCNFDFMIRGSYTKQVWPPLIVGCYNGPWNKNGWKTQG